jgi:hypothetical protein
MSGLEKSLLIAYGLIYTHSRQARAVCCRQLLFGYQLHAAAATEGEVP